MECTRNYSGKCLIFGATLAGIRLSILDSFESTLLWESFYAEKYLYALKIFFSFFQKFQYGYVFILKPAQLWTIILNGIFFVCQNWSALRVCWADCFEKSWKTLWGGKYHLNLINEVLGTYPSIWVLEVFSMEEWVKLNEKFF